MDWVYACTKDHEWKNYIATPSPHRFWLFPFCALLASSSALILSCNQRQIKRYRKTATKLGTRVSRALSMSRSSRKSMRTNSERSSSGTTDKQACSRPYVTSRTRSDLEPIVEDPTP